MKTSLSLAKVLIAFLATAASLNTACVAASEPSNADDDVGQAAQASTTGVNWVCVSASDHDNSGTNNSITAGYYDATSGKLYRCELPNGVATGTTECCSPTSIEDIPNRIAQTLSYEGWLVYYTNTSSDGDGLRIGTVSASGTDSLTGSWTATANKFTDLVDPKHVACEGCTAGTSCPSCWIDGNDHDNCTGVQISAAGYTQIGANAVYCQGTF